MSSEHTSRGPAGVARPYNKSRVSRIEVKRHRDRLQRLLASGPARCAMHNALALPVTMAFPRELSRARKLLICDTPEGCQPWL